MAAALGGASFQAIYLLCAHSGLPRTPGLAHSSRVLPNSPTKFRLSRSQNARWSTCLPMKTATFQQNN